MLSCKNCKDVTILISQLLKWAGNLLSVEHFPKIMDWTRFLIRSSFLIIITCRTVCLEQSSSLIKIAQDVTHLVPWILILCTISVVSTASTPQTIPFCKTWWPQLVFLLKMQPGMIFFLRMPPQHRYHTVHTTKDRSRNVSVVQDYDRLWEPGVPWLVEWLLVPCDQHPVKRFVFELHV